MNTLPYLHIQETNKKWEPFLTLNPGVGLQHWKGRWKRGETGLLGGEVEEAGAAGDAEGAGWRWRWRMNEWKEKGPS